MGCSNSPKTKENENSQKIIQYQEEFNIDLAKNKNIEKKESDDKARNSQDMLKINDKKGKKRKEEEEGKRKECEEEEQRRKEEEEEKKRKEEEIQLKERQINLYLLLKNLEAVTIFLLIYIIERIL